MGQNNLLEQEAGSLKAGKLVIVPTPLGNREDITLRALETLRNCDCICAEDTRVTAKLLSSFDIHKRLERLDEVLLKQRADTLAQRVLSGEFIAYCSDAGMPGVSDPGMVLVQACHHAGAAVEVLPGPTALSCAYVASGSKNPHFYFGGFFPRKDGERAALLQKLKDLDAALIFYESPKRLASALALMAKILPLREATVCRELTKLHEEVLRDSLPSLSEEFAQREKAGGIKGEIVVVIEGPTPAELSENQSHARQAARVHAQTLASQGLKSKEIRQKLVDEVGVSRNLAYELALWASRQDSSDALE